MKLKQQPEDFQVEELTTVVPGSEGLFAFYRLEKTGWTTQDALRVIGRRWKLQSRRFSCGGLKDRHAQTWQYLTIFRGPRRRLTHQRLSLQYLGQTTGPYTSQDIGGNRFRLTLRDLSTDDCRRLAASAEEVRSQGVPNYFDDQRFGSVAEGGFIARLVVLGQYENALRLALTGPCEHDRSAAKKEKAVLLRHWGNWQNCLRKPARSPWQRVLAHLAAHPDDFRGAIEHFPAELRSLYLAAYQSHLWNRMLACWLMNHLSDNQRLSLQLRLGEVPVHRVLPSELWSELEKLQLPLPSARGHTDPADPRIKLMNEILAEEGLLRKQLKLTNFRNWFFSKGERPALCLPNNLTWNNEPDEGHPWREKVLLSFELPRGSYATLIVKRLTLGGSSHGH
jgi:tRNA pseudouridine13 synthase